MPNTLSTRQINLAFERLSKKQMEALALVANGMTSKEIAIDLGITPSAVTQRIESARKLFNGASRQELARIFRDQVAVSSSAENDWTCNQNTGSPSSYHACKTNQVPTPNNISEIQLQDRTGSQFALADSASFELELPWAELEPRVVPEVLEGKNATVNRLLFAVGLSFGLIVTALVLLAVAGELGNLI